LRNPRLYSILLFLSVLLLNGTVTGCRVTDAPGVLSEHVSPVPQLSEASSPGLPAVDHETREIAWSEADEYVGTEVTVCGPVMDTKWASGSNGKPTFLNLGKPYPDPDRFTVVIWEEYRYNFPGPPEELYIGKTICVSGEVEEYKNSPQIEVRYPSQIEVH
jgi:DNA/RNA endonuclease YhcR with UshA esterase domain